MAAEQTTLNVPKDVIEPIINAHVSAAVAAALSDKDHLLRAAVAQVLNTPVDLQGNTSRCGYSSDLPYLQWIMQTAVRNAVKAAVVEEVGKHQEALKAAIAEQLKKTNSPLAKQLIEGMVGAMTHPDVLNYRLTVHYEPK
jgi:hypothetical protein